MAETRVGATLGDAFTLRAVIGRGPSGIVYRAWQHGMEREVAVKIMSTAADPEAVARFVREARGISRLVHPHLVTVFDSGETDDGILFQVMELCEGRRLDDELRSRGRLPAERVVAIMSQVCDAIGHAHDHGHVHGDLAPDNIVIGRRDTVKVLGPAAGRVAYKSPEELAGERVDRRGDVYALGVMSYELLSGRRPFDDDDDARVIAAHLGERAPRMSLVSRVAVASEIEAVVMQALAKSPAARPASARDFAEALVRALAASRAPRRRAQPAGAAVALAASGLALAATIALAIAMAGGPRATGGAQVAAAVEPHALVVPMPLMPPVPGPSSPSSTGLRAAATSWGSSPPGSISALGPVVAPPPPPPPPPPIAIASEPDGATVVIDGVRVGKTPMAVPRPVGDGRVKLELRRAGYRSETRVLTGSVPDIQVELRRAPPRNVQSDWDNGVIR